MTANTNVSIAKATAAAAAANGSVAAATSQASSATSNSIHESLPREFSKDDVFDKYRVDKILGTGSMGEVARVHIKEKRVGGSAFNAKVYMAVSRRMKRRGCFCFF